MTQAALVFEIDGDIGDRLSDALLEAGALSVTAEDALAGTPEEQPMFDEPGEYSAPWPRLRLRVMAASAPEARQLLTDACTALGIAVPATQIETIDDEDWVRKTQSQFPPIRISDRLWIVPSWETPPDPSAITLVLDPGRAFGTGSHPTTRLCLQWLDRHLRRGETVIDYGCGSGILAIAAMKLGARSAVGTDIDVDALATARNNARANQVECEFLPTQAPLTMQADIVIANILANPLKVLAPALAAHTRVGGRIALSGILSSHWQEVADCYRPWFNLAPPDEDDGWVCLHGTRREAAC